MSTLRERTMQKAKATRPEKDVTITELGEKYLVRGLSAKARNEWILSNQTEDDKRTPDDVTKSQANMVILCTFDPDDPTQPVFDRADRDALMEWDGLVLAQLSEPAMQLSGLLSKKDEVKNA